MKKVRVLENRGQANQLKNTEYAHGKFFNPIEDADGEWIISEQEFEEYLELTEKVKGKQFKFIRTLRQKEYNPIVPVIESLSKGKK